MRVTALCAVALALVGCVVFAAHAAVAQAPAPEGYPWPPAGCPWSYANCRNGYFPADRCIEQIPDSPPPSNNISDHFAAFNRCVCPPGTSGVECQILESPGPAPTPDHNFTAVCNDTGPGAYNGSAAGATFDGSFWNPSVPEHFECVADPVGTQLMLKDHRVNVAFDLHHGAGTFTVLSRWWTNSIWSSVQPVVWCDGTGCSAEYDDTGRFDFTISCAQANCSWCKYNFDCGNIYGNGFASGITWFQMGFRNQTAQSTADVTLFTNQPSIPMHCRRGECITPIPVPVPATPTSYTWLIITAVCVVFAFFAFVAARAIWRNRKAKQALLARRALRRAARAQKQLDAQQLQGGRGALRAAAGGAVSPASSAEGFGDGDDDERFVSLPTAPGGMVMNGGSGLKNPLLARGGGGGGVGGADGGDDLKQPLALDAVVGAAAADERRVDLCVVFHGLEYTINHTRAATGLWCCGKTVPRRILNDVSGYVRSGEIVALMGESGAGKTTLLDILSNTPKVGTISGHRAVYLDGHRVEPADGQFPDFVCYLASEDTLLASQTVFETVLFSARLRLTAPAAYADDPDEYFTDRCEQVLTDVGLWHIRDSRVGSVEFGGISSGERKRLALAIELVTDPLVLLADEPTSGLDSYSANLVMRVLHRTCRTRGMCVITAIHQPPVNTWPLFDRLLVLTRKGQLAYSGPAAGGIPFMTAVTGTKFPDDSNPAEFLLDTASIHFRKVADAYRRSDTYRQLQTDLAQLEQAVLRAAPVDPHTGLAPATAPVRRAGHVKTGVLTQSTLLSARAFETISRDPTLLLMTTVVTTLTAVLLGVVYYEADLDLSGSQNRCGFFFFCIFFFTFLSLNSISLFLNEIRSFARENSALFYGTLSFLFSKVVVDILPLRVLPPIVFAAIAYPMIGLQRSTTHFLIFLVILVLVNVVATAVCFTISALVHSHAKANLVAVVFFVYCLLFGGLFLNFLESGGALVRYVGYLRYTSFFHWSYDSLMINEFQGLALDWHPIGAPETKLTGETFLANLSIDADSFGDDVLGLSLIAAFFLGLAFVLLKYFQKQAR